MNKEIREFEERDLDSCYEIYRYFVDHSVWNLDLRPESKESFSLSISNNPDFPFLVAEAEGEIIGYGTAHHYRPKDGYQHAAELTLYFKEGDHHGLVGQMVDQLEDILKRQNVRLEIGCVTASNEKSLGLCERRNFTEYGRLKKAAWKNGAFYDVVWMKKTLADPDFDPDPETMPRFIPYFRLKEISEAGKI